MTARRPRRPGPTVQIVTGLPVAWRVTWCCAIIYVAAELDEDAQLDALHAALLAYVGPRLRSVGGTR